MARPGGLARRRLDLSGLYGRAGVVALPVARRAPYDWVARPRPYQCITESRGNTPVTAKKIRLTENVACAG
jgi:hypothetical protein